MLPLLAAAAVLLLLARSGDGEAPPPSDAPPPGAPFRDLPGGVSAAGVTAAALLFGRRMAASGQVQSGAQRAAEEITRSGGVATGPAGGALEARTYALSPEQIGIALSSDEARLASFLASQYPAPPAIVEALRGVQQPFVPAPSLAPYQVGPVSVVVSDGDGVLWISPHLTEELVWLRQSVIGEWNATGRTLEASRFLWAIDWPRLVRSASGAWALGGFGSDAILAGRGGDRNTVDGFRRLTIQLRGFFNAQNAARPDWNLSRQV